MFSVVITTHNRPHELERAIASIAAQTFAPNELIVIDDSSTPAVEAKRLAALAPSLGVRVVRHDRPRGPGGARNAGVATATQEWIAFLDDDDEFDPFKLQSLRDELDHHPEAALLYHPALIVMVNEGVQYRSSSPDVGAGSSAYRALLTKNVIGGTSMVAVRRDALQRAGGFDETLRAFEDYELWLRLARMGLPMRRVDRVLTRYHHVTRRGSVTQSSDAGMQTFAAIEARYQADFAALSTRERTEHSLWCHDTVTHRAILKLRYFETLASVADTLRTFRRPKYVLILAAACLGPRFLIRLRAWGASRRYADDTVVA